MFVFFYFPLNITKTQGFSCAVIYFDRLTLAAALHLVFKAPTLQTSLYMKNVACWPKNNLLLQRANPTLGSPHNTTTQLLLCTSMKQQKKRVTFP